MLFLVYRFDSLDVIDVVLGLMGFWVCYVFSVLICVLVLRFCFRLFGVGF